MRDRSDLLHCLLDGLDVSERQFVLDQISSAHSEQLEHHRNPPRRRRRDATGDLVWPEEIASAAR